MAKDGQVDAIFNITAVPAGGYLDLANSRRTWMVPITDEQFAKAKDMNAGWTRTPIPANAYPDQKQPVPIASFPMHIIVNCDSMSEETGYNIATVIYPRVKEIGYVTRRLAELTGKELASHVRLPVPTGEDTTKTENRR